MQTPPRTTAIRTKKLAVLLKNARQSKGLSPEECASAMGISVEQYMRFENGEAAPALQEVEALAFVHDLNLGYLLGKQNGPVEAADREAVNLERLLPLRQRIIGATIRQLRTQKDLSLDIFAERTGIPAEKLNSYELGELSVPLPELEAIAAGLDGTIQEFLDKRGPISVWFAKKDRLRNFEALPEELKEFVSKPINQPYLGLAKRLSEMDVEKLRAVAEGLLEITL